MLKCFNCHFPFSDNVFIGASRDYKLKIIASNFPRSLATSALATINDSNQLESKRARETRINARRMRGGARREFKDESSRHARAHNPAASPAICIESDK